MSSYRLAKNFPAMLGVSRPDDISDVSALYLTILDAVSNGLNACPECGEVGSFEYCPSCGYGEKEAPQTKPCWECGGVVDIRDLHCRHCGKQQQKPGFAEQILREIQEQKRKRNADKNRA